VGGRQEGGRDRSGAVVEAGARAFLQGSWQRRDLALLFASGDAPPGFEVLRRQRGREWIGQNDSLLHLTDVPEDRVYAAILTSLIGEGAYEVARGREPPPGRVDHRRGDRVRAAAHGPGCGQAFLIAEISNSSVTLSLTRTPPPSSAAFQVTP